METKKYKYNAELQSIQKHQQNKKEVARAQKRGYIDNLLKNRGLVERLEQWKQ